MKCNTEKKTMGWIQQYQSKFVLTPWYQRHSDLWGRSKKQLFIDSQMNGWDIPKLYLRAVEKTPGHKEDGLLYEVADGLQRISTVLSFMASEFPCNSELFTLPDGKDVDFSIKPALFKNMSDAVQEYYKCLAFDVCIIECEEDEVESLFKRLNNGTPLSAAERRNAQSSDGADLARIVASHKFFSEKVKFSNKRFQHLEEAWKLLAAEESIMNGSCLETDIFTDSSAGVLDRIAETNYTPAQFARLKKTTLATLSTLSTCFGKEDDALARQTMVPLYYILFRILKSKYVVPYGTAPLQSRIRKAVDEFKIEYEKDKCKEPSDRDPVLVQWETNHLQASNSRVSYEMRVNTLISYFLAKNDDVLLRDSKRNFDYNERYAIFIRDGKRCRAVGCGKELHSLRDMHADHIVAATNGGKTSLANAQALCEACNKSKGASLPLEETQCQSQSTS